MSWNDEVKKQEYKVKTDELSYSRREFKINSDIFFSHIMCDHQRAVTFYIKDLFKIKDKLDTGPKPTNTISLFLTDYVELRTVMQKGSVEMENPKLN